MPTYRYRCAKCGDEIEVWQSFDEKPKTRHTGGCGGKLAKVMSPAGIVLKGSGFYKTDNRSSSKSGAKRSSDASSSDGPSSDSSSTKSDGPSGSKSGESSSSGTKSGDSKSGDSSSSGTKSGGSSSSGTKSGSSTG